MKIKFHKIFKCSTLVFLGFLIFSATPAYAALEDYGQWGTRNVLSSGNIQKVPEGYALTAIGYGSDDHKCIMRIRTAPVNDDGSVDFANQDTSWRNNVSPDGTPCDKGSSDGANYKYFNPTDGYVVTGWSWGANTGGGGSKDGNPPDECFYQEYMNLATKQIFGWGQQYDGTCNERGYGSSGPNGPKSVIHAPAGRVIIGIGFDLGDDAKLDFLAITTRQIKTAGLDVSTNSAIQGQFDLSPDNKTGSGTISNINSTNGGSFTVGSSGCDLATSDFPATSLTWACPDSVGPFSININNLTTPGTYTAKVTITATGQDGTIVSLPSSKDITVKYVVDNPTPTPIVGECGTANGGTFSSPPTSDLCAPNHGTPSHSYWSANGPWEWECLGSNGGANSPTCRAKPTDVTCQLNASATTIIKKGESVNWSVSSSPIGLPYFWYVSGASNQSHVPGAGLTGWSGSYAYNTAGEYDVYFTVEKNGTKVCTSTPTKHLSVSDYGSTPPCPVDPNFGLNYYWNGKWCNPNWGPPETQPGGMGLSAARGTIQTVENESCDDDGNCTTWTTQEWRPIESYANVINWGVPLNRVSLKASFGASAIFFGIRTIQFDCNGDGTYERSGPVSYGATDATTGDLCNYPTVGVYTARARALDVSGNVAWCRDRYCEGKATVNVSSQPPLPSVTLSSFVTYFSSGPSYTLTWQTGHAVSCMASAVPPRDDWQGPKSPTGEKQKIGTPTATTRYTLTCSNDAGQTASDYEDICGIGGPCVFSGPPKVSQQSFCNAGPTAIVSWDYILDVYRQSQNAYRVQIDDNPAFSSPDVDTGKVVSNSTSWTGGGGVLQYNKTYYIRVRPWIGDTEYGWSVPADLQISAPPASCTQPDLTAGSATINFTNSNHTAVSSISGLIQNISATTNVSTSFNNKLQIDINNNDSVDRTMEKSLSSLATNTNAVLTFSGEPVSSLPTGTHSARICADLPPDPNGSISESNEDNNCGGEWVPFTINPTISPVNGACATPPNGGTYPSAPGGPLCSAGTAVPSSLSGSGPWNWTCNGINGGTNAGCHADKTVGPVCPTGSVQLSSSSVFVGSSVTASAPSGFSGGSFSSNNIGVASVSGSTVTGLSDGVATISGSGWKNSNDATSCSLSGATLTVPEPINGGWSAWTPASCPTSCGQPASTLNRTCTNPTPANGGTQCTADGSSATQSCSATAACACASPISETRTLSCSTGYSGTITQSRSKSDYPSCSWGEWVTISDTCTINSYTVTATTGSGGSISPSSRTVNYGSTTTFTVTPNAGNYYISSVTGCSGSLSGTTYTTGTITSTCAVSATFMSGTLTPTSASCVIPGGASACSINFSWNTTNPVGTSAITKPTNVTVATGNSGNNVPLSIKYNSERFYLYNNAALLDQKTVTSSCDDNNHWNGSTCVLDTYSLTISKAGTGSGTTTGAGTYNYGTSVTATATASTGSAFSGWSGDCNSSGQVTIDTNKACTATFTLNTYTVTATTGSGGSISPASRTVNYGSTATFTVTPDTGYSTSSVTGCGGTLSGTTYTTGSITSACTVSASFVINSYTVTATTGSGGSISPSSRTVNYGSTTTFTVTPNAGNYYISSVTGCSGSLSGTTYTTGTITSTCAVSATFMSGTLTPTSASCSISAGNNSCNVTLSWSTTNPIATSAVTASGMSNVNGNSGTQDFPVPYNSRTFYLYNNAKLLAQSSATASCATGTVWTGNKCETVVNGGWSAWSACSVTACGSTGTQTRTCTNPSPYPANVGADCHLLDGGNSSKACSASACTCPNGATNPPTCTITGGGGGGCVNGATNPPTCTIGGGGGCVNGATNPPACTITGGGECSNGAVNPPTCTFPPDGACSNGATNYPTCTTGAGENPVNANCSLLHYACFPNTIATGSQNSGTSSWTWTCNGLAGGANASCSEGKKKPSFIEN